MSDVLEKIVAALEKGPDTHVRSFMNYGEQHRFLKYSRICGSISVLCLIGSATILLTLARARTRPGVVVFGLTLAALAVSLFYTPGYLHLTVNPDKNLRWEVRIRWRLVGAGLIMVIFSVSNARSAIVALGAVAWLVGANLVAKAFVRPKYVAAYFWVTDFVVLAVSLLAARYDFLLATALLAAAAHLSIVACQTRPFVWSAVVIISGCAWILLSTRPGEDLLFALASAGVVSVSALETAWLVYRAQKWNLRNVNAALGELMDFTGYSAARVRNLWSVSNQQLAKNWQLAGLPEDDRERITQWYRENSELYLFAISAYNLEYKRIRSNLGMLKFARGSCLDYGAGNGELILELARRGHRATYFDVEGETMKFARQRAQRQELTVEFLLSKRDLAASAQERLFDTVFSFDVLEHLPDLAGELDFLCSVLNPGGLLVFDLPAGATKSHPMHLNHHLDVRKYLRGKGLEEKRSFLQKLPFRKAGKYLFQASAQ